MTSVKDGSASDGPFDLAVTAAITEQRVSRRRGTVGMHRAAAKFVRLPGRDSMAPFGG